MADLKELASHNYFGGQQKLFSHASAMCKCTMTFSVYVPPAVVGTVSKVPVLYILGGLTSTPEGFGSRSGFQKYAAENNLVVVTPDSSPRDTGLPGESDRNMFYGHGAGFYMDAITPGWSEHYNMFSYVTKELISIVERSFDCVLPGRRGIMGHSMGGHGTLLCALKNPDLYSSISCLAPVANASSDGPSQAAFEKYLGADKEVWKQWDGYELLKAYQGRPLDILVHIGTFDQRWEDLKVWQLVHATHGKDNVNLDLKVHAGYDHMLQFVSTFIGFHIKYHADILNKK